MLVVLDPSSVVTSISGVVWTTFSVVIAISPISAAMRRGTSPGSSRLRTI
jgi:hypothetical protein